MKIYIGADHRGFELKEKIKHWLTSWGYEIEDAGAFEYNKDDDYPDFAFSVTQKVAVSSEARGVLVCGSDVGMAIAANKIKGIRAGGATIVEQIKAAVNDDDINVLTLGADYLSDQTAQDIVKIFLDTKFSGDVRHVRRINKIINLEKNL
jgi:ribose 5-phosphate isomerase B